MKKTLITLATTLLLAGCVSTPTVQNEQQTITSLAAIGTAADLTQRPGDLPYFLATEATLYSLASSTNIVTANIIDAALQASGTTNKLEALGLTLVVNQADSYIKSNGGTNTQEVITWIADGINESAGNVLVKVQTTAKAKFHK